MLLSLKLVTFGMALLTVWWLIGWDPVVYFAVQLDARLR